jgi:sugar (pentulose or hexulose) kinase
MASHIKVRSKDTVYKIQIVSYFYVTKYFIKGTVGNEVRVSGGGAKSHLWRQILADIF